MDSRNHLFLGCNKIIAPIEIKLFIKDKNTK